MSLDEFQILLRKMVKERPRLFSNIFSFLNAEALREYKAANNSPTLQDRDQQKVLF